jgi:hypothetical protein
MRCLCHAKFLSGGSIPPSEFFAHISTKWSCVENTPNVSTNRSNPAVAQKHLPPKSIVFIVDCQSVKQLTSDLATLPGAGISNVEIFPVPEVLEYQ